MAKQERDKEVGNLAMFRDALRGMIIDVCFRTTTNIAKHMRWSNTNV